MPETIRIETDPRGVATLWLARPDKHNALSRQMLDELTEAARALAADDAVRVVVLAADGPSFCAGGDLGWMRQQIDADAETRREGARTLAGMLSALNLLPKPLIARVHGNAFGGGLGMMSVADVTLVADGARFGLTEVKLGLIPATIGPYVLARMGEERARRVYFSGRLFDASEARDLNLASRVVPAAELDAAVEAEIAPYLLAAPRAVAAAKAQCRALGARIDAQVIEDSIDRLVAAWEGPEAVEGITAFFDKRRPSWQS
ncbi:crotonase/enoyl-CoA hydratase family protein [Paracoccus sp. 1_MG-2023]|uniref:crotonase/enoyl-CoA hydratase family protein n=1 Tax=unclassified Paracoccus (in: a-proteobacteria) TaxID=2688777 RepID=UPI001C0924DD|nr:MULTISPECIES: crotonase/enoyl-CoA hydratase family protein [unclassified Paracoccus (in: a-proteobacteria)]MBU2958741.1 crotonase/enoyl-CoA hydratase family protein [Paracoccus sp. C2R09]MDO6667734.1 crotonase/enoyl-CoA hydratase family protein [Paracoccus sp. 1_MG-2023]